MTDTNIKLRKHYSAAGLTDRIKAALATVTPESGALTVAQLAPLDQFHTRGILATTRKHETTRFNLARYRHREFEKLKERKSLMKKYSYLICAVFLNGTIALAQSTPVQNRQLSSGVVGIAPGQTARWNVL